MGVDADRAVEVSEMAKEGGKDGTTMRVAKDTRAALHREAVAWRLWLMRAAAGRHVMASPSGPMPGPTA